MDKPNSYMLDFISNGTPLRVKLFLDTDIVKFYDRQYNTFIAEYTAEDLRLHISGSAMSGLSMSSVPEWTVDPVSLGLLLRWLDLVRIRRKEG